MTIFSLGPCGTKYSLWTSSSVSLQSLLKTESETASTTELLNQSLHFLQALQLLHLFGCTLKFEKSRHWLKVQLRKTQIDQSLSKSGDPANPE